MAEEKLSTLQKNLAKVFTENQLDALQRQSTRGMTWDVSTVKKALKLRFSCGSSGYDSLLQSGMPLPSLRTLRRRLEGIRYQPGILATVLNYLRSKVRRWTWIKNIGHFACMLAGLFEVISWLLISDSHQLLLVACSYLFCAVNVFITFFYY